MHYAPKIIHIINAFLRFSFSEGTGQFYPSIHYQWHGESLDCPRTTVMHLKYIGEQTTWIWWKQILYPQQKITTWRHQMKTFSALLALCEGIHWSPVDSPHKVQERGALIFSSICTWTSNWADTRDAGDLRRHRANYDVTAMTHLCGHCMGWAPMRLLTMCR